MLVLPAGHADRQLTARRLDVLPGTASDHDGQVVCAEMPDEFGKPHKRRRDDEE